MILKWLNPLIQFRTIPLAVVYIKTKDFIDYLDYRENINLRINEIIESAGAHLTVPVRAINLTPESALIAPST